MRVDGHAVGCFDSSDLRAPFWVEDERAGPGCIRMQVQTELVRDGSAFLKWIDHARVGGPDCGSDKEGAPPALAVFDDLRA